jgi:hypothetical protein
VAIKFRITIEESFGVIQKLLVSGFGAKIGTFTPRGSAADPDRALRLPPPPAPRSTFCGFEGSRYMIRI